MSNIVTIYGIDRQAKVGDYIEPDGWRFGERLQSSTWEAAEFYLPTGYDFGIKVLAVNIKVTGRTIKCRHGARYVRVQIEFVGDGEPSTFHSGWLLTE